MCYKRLNLSSFVFCFRDQILNVIPKVVKHLKEYLKLLQDMKKAEENLADAHQQMALVKEAEAQGHKHPLFNLASRCSELLAARSAHNTAIKLLKDKTDEYDKDINNYMVTIDHFNGITTMKSLVLCSRN